MILPIILVRMPSLPKVEGGGADADVSERRPYSFLSIYVRDRLRTGTLLATSLLIGYL